LSIIRGGSVKIGATLCVAAIERGSQSVLQCRSISPIEYFASTVNFPSEFDLDDYLRRQSAIIDRALEEYFSRYPAAQQTIFRAMRYGVFPGGKRIRPTLTLAAGELFAAPAARLLPFACAVELIHAYSLIHDDLPALDDDDLRRGEPAAHKVFGEGMALLAGDGLLTEAFHWISYGDSARGIAPDLVLRVIHDLSHAAGVMGLVGGQALDLEAEEQEADLATVEVIHVRKTGALILAAIRIGARLGGASDADLARITRYGEYLGLAFQIADDILDARGEGAAQRTESAHKEHKKATYPLVVGIAQAKQRLDELTRLALSELEPFGARAVPLAAIANHVAERALRGHG
jgi:geranylgeranyl diphosphate synthase type II